MNEADTPEWKAFVRRAKYLNAKLKKVKIDSPQETKILNELVKLRDQYEKIRSNNGYGSSE